MVPLISCAQEEPPPDSNAPPKPAGYSFPNLGAEPSQGQLQPDYSPLTGMQNATIGIPEIRHSYWAPGLQFGSNISQNSYGQTNSSWNATNYFIGTMSLLKAWDRGTLAVNYSGGGFVSTDSLRGNGWYQTGLGPELSNTALAYPDFRSIFLHSSELFWFWWRNEPGHSRYWRTG